MSVVSSLGLGTGGGGPDGGLGSGADVETTPLGTGSVPFVDAGSALDPGRLFA